MGDVVFLLGECGRKGGFRIHEARCVCKDIHHNSEPGIRYTGFRKFEKRLIEGRNLKYGARSLKQMFALQRLGK